MNYLEYSRAKVLSVNNVPRSMPHVSYGEKSHHRIHVSGRCPRRALTWFSREASDPPQWFRANVSGMLNEKRNLRATYTIPKLIYYYPIQVNRREHHVIARILWMLHRWWLCIHPAAGRAIMKGGVGICINNRINFHPIIIEAFSTRSSY